MALNNELWWSVWWPWILTWTLSVASIVITVAIVVVHRRTRRKISTNKHHIRGVCFYLNERSVMDLYQLHNRALTRKVRKEMVETNQSTITVTFGTGISGSRSDTREVFRKYIETNEPISIVNTILDVLEEAGDIVNVDLRNERITPNRAVTRAWLGADGHETSQQQSVRLRDLETFVSVWGQFRMVGITGESMIFLAPYGEPVDPSEGPQIRVTCAVNGLRAAIPDGTFLARCVGRVQEWNPERRELTIQPITIFQ